MKKYISPSNIFSTLLLPAKFHQNFQAAFGRCEHEWVKPPPNSPKTDHTCVQFFFPIPHVARDRFSGLPLAASQMTRIKACYEMPGCRPIPVVSHAGNHPAHSATLHMCSLSINTPNPHVNPKQLGMCPGRPGYLEVRLNPHANGFYHRFMIWPLGRMDL